MILVPFAKAAAKQWPYRESNRRRHAAGERPDGIALCPESAAGVAAEMLIEVKKIRREDRVVLFNTGSATKYIEAVPINLPTIDNPHTLDYGRFMP
jgi:threonine synthase